MLDLDLAVVWRQGRGTFTCWAAPAWLLSKYLLVRRSTRLSVARSLAADLAMTGACYLFVVGMPLAIIPWVAVHYWILDRIPDGCANPMSWIGVLLLSALIAAACDFAVLSLAFRQRTGKAAWWWFVLANLLCIGLAAMRMAAHLHLSRLGV
jgi:hypothetical protein